MFPSRLHLPAPLGSTVISRFIATTGTLTPAPLPPTQVSLVAQRALPDIPSPTTPCAPVFRQCFLFRAGLAPDSLWFAIGGSSDFAHYSQSHQSHEAVSSSCRGVSLSLSSTDYLFTSSCSPPHVAMMQLLSVIGGKLRQRGTSTLLCTLLPKRTSAPVPGAATFELQGQTNHTRTRELRSVSPRRRVRVRSQCSRCRVAGMFDEAERAN